MNKIGSYFLVLLPLLLGLIATQAAALPPSDETADGSQSFLPTIARSPSLVVIPVGEGFSAVTTITHANDARLFIGQRTGEIYTLEPDGSRAMFLDLSGQVIFDGSEYGLYDVAFHPDYATNGLMYVIFTTRIDRKVYLVLARYRTLPGSRQPEPSSAAILMRIRQDSDLHKGGGLDFDRLTHWLYMGVGEDTQIALAQDPNSEKGKVLRLAVDDVPIELIGNAEGRAEVQMWAMGFRNPWRVDVDELNGLVYVADVGSGSWEEVNAAKTTEPGSNFGWPCREGSHFFPPGNNVDACRGNPTLTDPLFAYSHEDGRCAIIGGQVYRPQTNPSDGRYVFGDLCTQQLFALATGSVPADPRVALGTVGTSALLTLGEDASGNLYAGNSQSSGPVYRLILP